MVQNQHIFDVRFFFPPLIFFSGCTLLWKVPTLAILTHTGYAITGNIERLKWKVLLPSLEKSMEIYGPASIK
jgi:hypothetical protein